MMQELEFLGNDKPVNQIGPLLSVCIMTYQHGKYITECLEGVLIQKTNFPIEIIIGEDESTDGTREICKTYAEKYPEKIRLFLRSRKDVIQINGANTGRFNLMQTLKAAKGKYIALCEGDDYWTDPFKLQKQVDYLESHQDVALCFHRANIFRNEIFKIHPVPDSIDGIYTYNQLFSQHNFITTASVVFRNVIQPIPNWFVKIPYGDMGLYYFITRHGKIACLPEVMSVYRIHEGGMWSGRKKIDAYWSEYKFYQIMYPILKGEERKTLLMKASHIMDVIAMEIYPKNKLFRFFCTKYLKYNLT